MFIPHVYHCFRVRYMHVLIENSLCCNDIAVRINFLSQCLVSFKNEMTIKCSMHHLIIKTICFKLATVTDSTQIRIVNPCLKSAQSRGQLIVWHYIVSIWQDTTPCQLKNFPEVEMRSWCPGTQSLIKTIGTCNGPFMPKLTRTSHNTENEPNTHPASGSHYRVVFGQNSHFPVQKCNHKLM